MFNILKLARFTKIAIPVKQSDFYPKEAVDLSDKYFVVTGANSGLGFETTKVLLQMKANVIMVCRNQTKMDNAINELPTSGKIYPLCFDMSDLEIVAPLVESLKKIVPGKIDAFVHNAGALLNSKSTTKQNFESTFALMTLVPFKLTQALIHDCHKFIWVSSGGMYGTAQNLSDYNWEKRPYDGVMAYAESKRNQVDLAALFASKYPEVQSFSMHPGWVDTPGVQDSLPVFRKMTRPFLRNYYQGCDTILYLAIEDIAQGNGEFWFDRQVVPQSYFKKGPATSREKKQKLWDLLSAL